MHLRVVPEPGLEQQRDELWKDLRLLWAGLGVLMLELEGEHTPETLYDAHKRGEKMATALSVIHDDLAKLADNELEEK